MSLRACILVENPFLVLEACKLVENPFLVLEVVVVVVVGGVEL